MPISDVRRGKIAQHEAIFWTLLIYDVLERPCKRTCVCLIHVEIPLQDSLLKVVWLPGRLWHLFDGLLGSRRARSIGVVRRHSCWGSKSLTVYRM